MRCSFDIIPNDESRILLISSYRLDFIHVSNNEEQVEIHVCFGVTKMYRSLTNKRRKLPFIV
jgi:hypothetical protein